MIDGQRETLGKREKVTIVGCDPGLANFGVAVVELGRHGECVVHLETIATIKSSRKLSVLAAHDNVRRCRELSARLLVVAGQHGPRVICAESMSAPRSASSAAKLAMSWGALSAVAQLLGLPLVQASPQAIKRTVAGHAAASKADVQGALMQRFGLPELFEGMRKGDVEHAADALGAAVTCLDSDVVRMARTLVA